MLHWKGAWSVLHAFLHTAPALEDFGLFTEQPQNLEEIELR